MLKTILKPLVNFKPRGFFYTLPFVLFLTGSVFSQVSVDSLSDVFSNKPRLIGGAFSRYTFIDGFQQPVYGLKGGVDFNSTLRFGLGIAKLKWPYERPNAVYKNNMFSTGEFTFDYFMAFAEYVFYNDKRWEFSMPLNFGIGRLRSRYYNGSILNIQKKGVMLIYEPLVACHYKIIPWFAVGSDIGFRFLAADGKKNTGVQFNSPVYAFKTIIFWGKLYDMYIKKK